MKISSKQLKANRKNAKRSTGPKTLEGKAVVSVNALRHGILSTKLILPNESRADFDALLSEMTQCLNPIGFLEQVLIEKISTNLWRQRRLIQAESAQLSLQTLHEKVTEDLNEDQLVKSITSYKSRKMDFNDKNFVVFSKDLLNELGNINIDKVTDISELELGAPYLYDYINKSASELQLTVEEYIEQHTEGCVKLLNGLKQLCEAVIEEESRRKAVISQIKKWTTEKNTILWGEMEQHFTRYQVSLNNELRKDLKALREEQEWRNNFDKNEAIIVNKKN